MYHLLIEAAGLRQASRLHPVWHGEFIRSITHMMEARTFHLLARDGDILVFRDGLASVRQPEEFADILRSLCSELSTHSDTLLDFVVLGDFRDRTGEERTLDAMERYLRHVRIQDAAYITEPVALALEPVVELEGSGRLFRIVSFRDEYRISDVPYSQFVSDETSENEVKQALIDGGTRNYWFVTPDISAVSGALGTVLDSDVIQIACSGRTHDAVLLDLLRIVLASSPDPDTLLSADTPDADLLRRFFQPGRRYLPTPYISGELELALETALHHFHGSGHGSVVIVLEGVDHGSHGVARAVARSYPGSVAVVSGEVPSPEPPGDEPPWLVREVPGGHPERAYRYWSSLGGQESPDLSAMIWHLLTPRHRNTLFVLHRTAPLLPPGVVDRFFQTMGITMAERTRIVRDLLRTGLLVHEKFPVSHRLTGSVVDHMMGPETDDLARQLQQFILEQLKQGEIHLSPPLWDLIRDGLSDEAKAEHHHTLIHDIAAAGSFPVFEEYAGVTGRDGKVFQLSNASGRLRLYLRDSRGPEACADIYQEVRKLLAETDLPPHREGDIRLTLGEYFLACRDYPQALMEVKQAVLLGQEAADGGGSGEVPGSHLLMARIMFSQRRLNDAGRYLGFAMEQSPDQERSVLVAPSLEAIRLFLVGNLSRSLGSLTAQLTPLLEEGYTDWYLLLRFLHGRILYELGDYAAARKAFDELRSYSERCGIDAPRNIAVAWALRSRLSGGDPAAEVRRELQEEEERPETMLFLAESFAGDGLFADALPLLERAISIEESVDRWPRLSVCWDNGFASIEDMMIADRPGSSELLRILNAYYAWTLSHLGRQDEAVPIFYSLTRGNGGSVLDPYTGLYNFLYSSVLPEERSGDRDDRATVLGRSVKLVQERTSRIDEYAHKLSYLRKNTWNRRLMSVARQHNLV
jgi:tetratricopeptide (TPR) repeat protein